VTYEEIIPILHELNEKFPAVPLDIIEASKKAKSDWGVKKHFRHEPTGTRRNLLGVRDDAKSPDAFFGVAKDPKRALSTASMSCVHHGSAPPPRTTCSCDACSPSP